MTDPAAKQTWTEESFDDVETTSPGTLGACRVIREPTCIGPDGCACFSAVRLGDRSAAVGYLKKKLAEMARSPDPALCQNKPTAELQNCGCLYRSSVVCKVLCSCMSSQAGAQIASQSAAW